ncbi:MAG: hypothetical protein ACREMJ_07870 [Gemmatimonadales bacterium]
MSTKKAVRKRRGERDREKRGSRRRGTLNLLLLVLVAALIVLATALILGPGNQNPAGDQVWSPEHGHWHRR